MAKIFQHHDSMVKSWFTDGVKAAITKRGGLPNQTQCNAMAMYTAGTFLASYRMESPYMGLVAWIALYGYDGWIWNELSVLMYFQLYIDNTYDTYHSFDLTKFACVNFLAEELTCHNEFDPRHRLGDPEVSPSVPPPCQYVTSLTCDISPAGQAGHSCSPHWPPPPGARGQWPGHAPSAAPRSHPDTRPGPQPGDQHTLAPCVYGHWSRHSCKHKL